MVMKQRIRDNHPKEYKIICGGRGKGKMMDDENFLKLFPEDKVKDIIVARASDTPPKLKGSQLPRMIEITERDYLIAECIKEMKNERQD